jgi:hypothetical protein
MKMLKPSKPKKATPKKSKPNYEVQELLIQEEYHRQFQLQSLENSKDISF